MTKKEAAALDARREKFRKYTPAVLAAVDEMTRVYTAEAQAKLNALDCKVRIVIENQDCAIDLIYTASGIDTHDVILGGHNPVEWLLERREG